MTRWVTFSQVGYGLALGGALAAHLLGDRTGMSCLLILSLLQLYPFFYALCTRSLDFMAFILLGSFAAYALYRFGQWWVGPHPFVFTRSAVFEMHTLSLCMLAVLGGFYFTRHILKRHLEAEYLQRSRSFRTFLLPFWQCAALLAVVILISLFAKTAGGAQQPLHAVGGVCLVVLLTSCVGSSAYRLYLLWGGLILHSAYLFLWTGTLHFAVSVTLIWIVQWLLFRTWHYAIALAAMAILLISLQMIKADFRGLLRRNAVTGTSDRARAVVSVFAERALRSPANDRTAPTIIGAVSRLGDNSLEKVLQYTPHPVPFWNGRTYAPLVYAFVPRIVWPARPPRDIWHVFGRTYGYLEPYDHYTSVTLNYLSEAFMNYGYVWLLLVACLFGVVAAFAEYIALFAFGGRFAFTYTLLVLKLLLPNDTVSVATDLVATCLFLLVLQWMWRLRARVRAPNRFLNDRGVLPQ